MGECVDTLARRVSAATKSSVVAFVLRMSVLATSVLEDMEDPNGVQ